MNSDAIDSVVREYQTRTWTLRIEDGEISVKTRFSKKTIALSDVDKVSWNGFGHVQILCQKQTIEFSCLSIRDIPLRNEVMLFLRQAVPHEKQIGWKNLCYNIDKNFDNKWMPKEKLPSNREPDPAKGEYRYTRKHCMKTLLWLVALTILIMIGTYCLYSYLWKLYPNEMKPIHNPSNMFFISAVFCLCPWLTGLFFYFRIPKEGMVVKRLSHKNKEEKTALAIMIFLPFIMIPVYFVIYLLVCLIEKFGIIVFFAIFVISSLIVAIPPNVVEYRKYQQRMAEMPDDYIPEILTRKFADQSGD